MSTYISSDELGQVLEPDVVHIGPLEQGDTFLIDL